MIVMRDHSPPHEDMHADAFELGVGSQFENTNNFAFGGTQGGGPSGTAGEGSKLLTAQRISMSFDPKAGDIVMIDTVMSEF